MITIKTENYNHISQDFYNKIIDSLDLTLISCTCGHSGSLIRHGSYKRKIPLNGQYHLPLTVVRVYCKHCGHTHALLLSSFVPYSQIPLTVHIRPVSLLMNMNSSIPSRSGRTMPRVDENNIRSIFRSYRLTLAGTSARSCRSDTFQYLLCLDNRLLFPRFRRQFMQIKSTCNKLFLLPT